MNRSTKRLSSRGLIAGGLLALALTLGGCIYSSKHGCSKCDGSECKCKGQAAQTCPTCHKSMDQCKCPKASAMSGPATKDAAKPSKVATANTVCPVGGDEFDAAAVPVSLTRVYKGKTIGFCCESCPPAFDKADAAGKDKLLAEAMAHPAK
jgi:hypothetical protein